MQPPKEISYEDFEPLCKWRREQNSDTLEVHLPGFKRQHLTVKVTSSGVLTITGERQMDEDKKKRSRFRKELPLSENYQTDQIQAKFSNSILYLVMPKQISTISGVEQKVTSCSSLSSIMNRYKRITLEIIIAISLAVAIGVYVKKYCHCSH